jgi:hypothetical protein
MHQNYDPKKCSLVCSKKAYHHCHRRHQTGRQCEGIAVRCIERRRNLRGAD